MEILVKFKCILIELNLVLLTFKDASSLYIIAFFLDIGHHYLTFIWHLSVFLLALSPAGLGTLGR